MRRCLLITALMSVVAVLLTTAEAGYTVAVSPACDGAGISGTAQNLNVTISFEACATLDGYHAVVRDAAGLDLVEVFHNSTTDETEYWIDGIETGPSHTPEELSRMEGVMMSKEIVSVASRLYVEMDMMGFDQTSSPMIAIGGIMAGLVDDEPYTVSGNLDCNACLNSPKCKGCCGFSCWGCTGYCTEECWEHDNCFRKKIFGACTGKFLQAVGSWFGAMRAVDDCGRGGGSSGGGGGGSGGGCQDPSGCCPDDYHECCNNQCCNDWNPPDQCP